MPSLASFLSEGRLSDSKSPHPENFRLVLPSTLPSQNRAAICTSSLAEIEHKLRTAQCSDALDSLRHILWVKTRMVHFKNKNMRGQHEGTHSRSVIDRVHRRAQQAAEKYRFAREAKLSLCGPGDWELKWRKLADSDIHSYTDSTCMRRATGREGTSEDMDGLEGGPVNLLPEERHVRDGTGETQCTLSWIWTVEGQSISPDSASDDILQSEWAKSRALAARATEEVQLLREEMRCVLAFLDWKSSWWMSKKVAEHVKGEALSEGLAAYAVEQAALQIQLKTAFQAIWKGPLEDVESAKEISNADPEADDDDEDDEDDDDGDDDKDEEVDDEDKVEVGQPQRDDYFKGMDIEDELTCK